MNGSAQQVEWNIIQRLKFLVAVKQNFPMAIANLGERYGDTFWWQVGQTPYYVISRPEHVRDVLVTNAKHIRKDGDYTNPDYGLARFFGDGLVTSEGDFWRRQRKMVAPAFHTTRINDYADTMATFAAGMVGRWQDGARLDVADEMMQVTLDIITHTLLNQPVTADIARIPHALAEVQSASRAATMMPAWISQRLYGRGDAMVPILDEIIYPIIAARRAEGVDRSDVLSMLLAVEDEDGNRMTDKEVRDEIVILFLAGHETTANTLNWTFYLLGKNPDAEAKLHAELDRVLAGRRPTLTDLRQLPYTQQVIKEAMRLYPPVPGISREATADIRVGDFTIPRGSIIAIFPWLTHRDPTIWEEPLAFRPERFSAENEASIDKWAFYPFGGGQRVCIGNSFALMEAPLVLATVAARYSLSLAPRANVVPEASITLYPKYGLPMVAHQRGGVGQAAGDTCRTEPSVVLRPGAATEHAL